MIAPQLCAIAALGFAGVTGWAMNERSNGAHLEAELAAMTAASEQCHAILSAFLEGEEIDDEIPDDLGGVGVPPGWMLPAQ